MSKNVCSIYKYTVGMFYAAGRGEKGDVVKDVHSKQTCLCEPNYQLKEARKESRAELRCAFERARCQRETMS